MSSNYEISALPAEAGREPTHLDDEKKGDLEADVRGFVPTRVRAAH
jgi:hypothetical protein